MTAREINEVVAGLVRKFRVLVVAVVVMLVTMAAVLTFAGFMVAREFDERIDETRRLELSVYESARAAKAQTCQDLNEIRVSIRAVLQDSAENPEPGEDTPERRARVREALKRFAAVDCEARVQRLFGEGP